MSNTVTIPIPDMSGFQMVETSLDHFISFFFIYTKRSRLMDHLKTRHFRPFEYRTVWVPGIQMNPVFGHPVIRWLLYSDQYCTHRKASPQFLNSPLNMANLPGSNLSRPLCSSSAKNLINLSMFSSRMKKSKISFSTAFKSAGSRRKFGCPSFE